MLFEVTDNSIKFVSSLDKQKKAETGGSVSAMRMFRDMDKLSIDSASGPDAAGANGIASLHQNTITSVSAHTVTGDKVAKFATSGIDSKLIIWDVKVSKKC